MSTPNPDPPPARAVACPICGANPGEKCQIHGTELEACHAARGALLNKQNEIIR